MIRADGAELNARASFDDVAGVNVASLGCSYRSTAAGSPFTISATLSQARPPHDEIAGSTGTWQMSGASTLRTEIHLLRDQRY